MTFWDNLTAGTIITVVVAIEICIILAWTRIFRNAGYSPWYTVLSMIPFVNIVILIWFGFSKWPVSLEMRAIKKQNKVFERELKQARILYCPHCGEEINNSQDYSCPECDALVGDNHRYCVSCGAEFLVTRICPMCNAETAEEDAFCPKCGHSLN